MKTLTFEKGVSDHHKLVGVMLRSTFPKKTFKKCFTVAIKTLKIKYFKKNYKRNYCQYHILNHSILHLSQFAPFEKDVSTKQQTNFMTKKLCKAVMKKFKIRNKFNKEKSIENWSKYKHLLNLRSNLLKQSKKRHFSNLILKDVTERKHFWKTIKPFFTEKPKPLIT